MKVALYARISTDDKDQTNNTQLFAMRKFCQDAGWEIYHEYCDEARAKDYQRRKGWGELQRDARRMKFKTVVVFKLDRAFRSVRECSNVLQEWNERGIAFRSITQDAIDTTTSMGKFVLYILAAAAELESGLISDRVKAGMARAKAEGHRVGKPPLLIPSQTICEALEECGNVRVAARQLGCSVPYIYKVLTPMGLNPSKIAKGEKYRGH